MAAKVDMTHPDGGTASVSEPAARVLAKQGWRRADGVELVQEPAGHDLQLEQLGALTEEELDELQSLSPEDLELLADPSQED